MPGENMLVFRDDAELVAGPFLARQFVNSVAGIKPKDSSSVINVLLLAGQIECSLADLRDPNAAKAAWITDQLAELLLDPGRIADANLNSTVRSLAETFPETLRISHPEGFSYYGLHPRDFADVFIDEIRAGSFAVIGIRSIGTTLSAISAAALRSRCIPAQRTTVRPTGHPYDRRTSLSEAQQLWVERENQHGSTFVIVDEGPGLSGSSFLSVAECLIDSNVSSDRILLLGTHDVDPDQLCAREAALRWRKFSWRSVQSGIYERFRRMTPLSGGQWRRALLPADADWPPSWQEMESLKFWSDDRQSIFKFEGLGEVGMRVRDRARVLHGCGFGPEVHDADDGMTCYRYIDGRTLTTSQLSRDVLDRIAEYCAFRASAFKGVKHGDDQIRQMVRHNFHEETGGFIELPEEALMTDSPVIVDARMQPHEWIRSTSGQILKVDAGRHGDDHFLPGPTDIRWDLAGAIVEWNMDAAAEEYLAEAFRRRSGETASDKLRPLLLAYSTSRMGYCRMAANGTQDPQERLRLRKAYLYYRDRMLLAARGVTSLAQSS